MCAAVASAGCGLIVDAGQTQCAEDADCEARGFDDAVCEESVCVEAPPPDLVWGCLGDVIEPTADPNQRVLVEFVLVYAVNEQPVTSITVDVCDKLDVNCVDPDTEDYPKDVPIEADGTVKLSLRQGFDGYLNIHEGDVMPSRVYVGRPVVVPPSIRQIQLLKPSEYSALAGIAQGEVDPARGSVIFRASDCQGFAASGVRFESPNADEDSIPFYLINQSPTIPPTATETDADGFGGIFNVAPAQAVGRSFRAIDDRFVGESSFQVVAGTITYVQIAPTPE